MKDAFKEGYRAALEDLKEEIENIPDSVAGFIGRNERGARKFKKQIISAISKKLIPPSNNT